MYPVPLSLISLPPTVGPSLVSYLVTRACLVLDCLGDDLVVCLFVLEGKRMGRSGVWLSGVLTKRALAPPHPSTGVAAR